MAFKTSYGNGSLGDVTEVTTTINSYANVTAVNSTSITIDAENKLDGGVGFNVGEKILLHVSASVSGDKVYLGNWLLANITAVAGNVLTLDTDPTTCIPSDQLAKYYVQAITVAQYQNLTISNGTTIIPPAYSTTSYYGGIVALMCSDTLKFDGGHISLSDRGIPPASKALRPVTNNDPTQDIEMYAGWENSDTRNHFMLNSGDGAAFIVAKKMVCHNNSRIGNISSYGCQFYRGNSATSVTYGETAPSSVTNVGGSTIFIAAETIENFGHKMLAKYRASSSAAGQGICRCYIASETKLRNDEGLYAYDCISNPSRVTTNLNIKNFGNGSFGDAVDLTSKLNNYATITAIDGQKVTIKNATTDGLVPFSSGALVMIHFNHKGSTNVADSGRFILANVLSRNNSVLTLDTAPPAISITNYAAQVVTIPQFNNFTLSTTNSATPAFDGAQGGICAIAVKNTCNLSSGSISVVRKGGGGAYAREGLALIGNAQDSDKLPIGQGHGSVFILANKLTMNSSTRIGYGSGMGVVSYRGTRDNDRSTRHNYCGSGAGAYESTSTSIWYGGYGSNAKAHANHQTHIYKYQGAHIMIIADTINNFTLSAIGTGGGSGYGAGYGCTSNSGNYNYYGGYNAGGSGTGSVAGGGSSGWAFVYSNNATSPNTSGVILAN